MLSLHRRSSFRLAALAFIGTAEASRAEAPLGVEAYVQAVLRAHPASRQLHALGAAGQAERKAGRQWPDPTLTYTWDRASLPGIPNSENNEWGWSVSQTVPWPGTLSASSRVGDQASAALGAEAKGLRWELEVEARSAFARTLNARVVSEIARAAEADALALRDLTARRAELGEAREVDRIKAEVEWLRQQRTRRAREREVEAAESILRTLAREPLPQPLVLAGELPATLGPVAETELRARLQQSNPRLLAARAAAARDLARRSVSQRSRFPDLDLSWFQNRELDKRATGFSVGVRVPLWNANRAEVARATAAATLAEATAERVLVELSTALEQAHQELDVASTQAQMLEREILPAASRGLELARFSYQEGEASLLDLLDAQRTFRETQHEASAARLALALALAEVQRLVGPDFNPGR